MDRLFRVNSHSVVAEIIDGEAVIMDLKSGNYFSTDETGGVVWQWIEEGLTYSQMLGALNEKFAADRAQVIKTLAPFLSDLLSHQLVSEEVVEDGAPLNGAAMSALDKLSSFSVPMLNVYSDMKDLLLLDPIHDVSEVGWPTAKPERDA